MDETKKMFDEMKAEFTALIVKQGQELDAAGKVSAETKAALAASEAKYAELEGKFSALEAKMATPNFGMNQKRESLAEVLTKGGMKLNEMKRTKGSFFEVKAVTDSTNTAIASPTRMAGIFTDPADRINHIRDLMNVARTESNSVEFVADYAGFTNNAASQWNSGASPARIDGGTKAESTQTMELKTLPVVTIAHHLFASRQVLSDNAMLQSYIEGRLAYGVRMQEDNQILNGAGTNGTLTGIMNTTGIGDVGDRASSSVTYLDHIRSAILTARLSEYPVDGILLHPTDFAAIEMSKDLDGRYILLNVITQGVPALWRVPVVESTAITQGTFLVGSWRLGATLWDREDVGVRISDSHANTFIQNVVTLLGEERVCLTVERPKAFCKGSFDVAST